MVDHDLPNGLDDFDRRGAARVLSPAATLHHEAITLLAEDPTIGAGSPIVHHSILGAIANGSVTAGTVAKHLQRSVPNIDPALKRLIDAGFVVRHADPIRSQRPTYTLADPPRAAWRSRLAPTFHSRVRGPVFEEQARLRVRRHADSATLGGDPDHVGPSAVVVQGTERQLDVVVAADLPETLPSQRPVLAIGEAKAGETAGNGLLTDLELARASAAAAAAAGLHVIWFPSAVRHAGAGTAHGHMIIIARGRGGGRRQPS